MEAAAAKMFNTELLWDLMDTAVQLRGGRVRDRRISCRTWRGRHPYGARTERCSINRTVEGTTDIMHLFLAREALIGT